MDIDKYDLNITKFLKLEKLKQAVCNLKPCRPKRFESAIRAINYDKIVMFLGSPALFERCEVKGIVYWKKVEFENDVFSYKFALLFPFMETGNNKDKDKSFTIEAYHRGKSYPCITKQIQLVVDQIAEQLIAVNEA